MIRANMPLAPLAACANQDMNAEPWTDSPTPLYIQVHPSLIFNDDLPAGKQSPERRHLRKHKYITADDSSNSAGKMAVAQGLHLWAHGGLIATTNDMSNRTVSILGAASEGGYAVLAQCCYGGW